jgi:signal peptidase
MSVLTQNLLTNEDTSCAPRANGDAERSGLVADALRLGGRIRLRVHGESMLPALWPADIVEIAHCSLQEVYAGDIVLALRDGRLFLHRLVGPATEAGFKLRGDSMPGPDPWFPREAFLGRRVEPKNGPRVLPARLSRAIGMILCHFSMARRVALKLHSLRMRPAREFQKLEAS